MGFDKRGGNGGMRLRGGYGGDEFRRGKRRFHSES